MMITEAEKILNEEEQQDSGLRATQGARWTPLPSQGMNQPYRQNLAMYKTKIEQAKVQDENSQKRFNDQKGELEILGKTPQDLAAMMPQSESAQTLSERPCSKAIKQGLDNIEAAKSKKEDLMREVVEKLANLNMIESLMEVHTGSKQKDEVFSVLKEEYTSYFTRVAEQDQLITSANTVIQQNFGDFAKLKQSIQIDPTRQQFFQRIDLALMCQQDLENMLH